MAFKWNGEIAQRCQLCSCVLLPTEGDLCVACVDEVELALVEAVQTEPRPYPEVMGTEWNF